MPSYLFRVEEIDPPSFVLHSSYGVSVWMKREFSGLVEFGRA